MKMGIRIVCDSACDITQEQAKEWGITILPLKNIWGEEEYLDGITMTPQMFYERLIETDVLPTTSQITPFEYETVFEEAAKAGDTVLCLTVSAKLSGCYQSACIARQEYEDRVILIDTCNVALGEHILVKRAVELRDLGRSPEEIAETIEAEKSRVRLIALLDTLEYLKKGGRVSATAALAGTVLNIKPVVSVVDGEVVVLGKARGSKNGNNKLMELVRESGGVDFERPYLLGYSGLSDELLQKYIRDSAALYQGKTEDLPIAVVGSVIGTHAGPGAIALAFFSNQ